MWPVRFGILFGFFAFFGRTDSDQILCCKNRKWRVSTKWPMWPRTSCLFLDVRISVQCEFSWAHICTNDCLFANNNEKEKKNGSRCIEYNEYVHCGTATNSINRSSGSARPECALWATSCEGRVLFAFMRTYECVTINYMQSVTWPRLNTYKYMHLSHFSYTVETNEPSNAPTARRRQTKK